MILNALPDELINYIFKIYFTENCLPKIKRKICSICYNKIDNNNCMGRKYCVKCKNQVCLACWDGYMMNYYRGFMPGLKNCPDCRKPVIEEILQRFN